MTTLANGHTIEELGEKEYAQYVKDFAGPNGQVVKVNPGGWVLTKEYAKFEEKLTKFKFRADDVVVMTFPKCGTTWMQEIVWTMRNNPNLDNPEAETALFTRSPFIDGDMLMPNPNEMKYVSPEALQKMPDMTQVPMFRDFAERCPGKEPADGIMLQLADAMTEPRVLKTHLPFSLLNKELIDTCKVIYVARNPKDTILSFLHHCRLMKAHIYTGSQDTFVQYFVDDMLLWGSYAKHLKEAWAIRTHPNLHLVFYEDLKADIVGEIKKIAAFIGVTLTDQQLKNVLHKTSFSTMQVSDPFKMDSPLFFDQDVKKKDGNLCRKGEAGAWKGKFTPEQEAKVDDWVEKNFTAVGFEFKYQ